MLAAAAGESTVASTSGGEDPPGRRTVEPDPEFAARYEEQYRKFKLLYPALKPVFKEIAQSNTMDWKYKKHYDCWCREHIVYCDKPTVPKNQYLSIYVPAAYMKEGGSLTTQGSAVYTAETVPVVYLNIIGGYWSARPIGPLMMQGKYLKEGYVVVTVGARGRNTPGGRGKATVTLVDLKVGIRYLRRHRKELPGYYDKIITVGTSAGGGTGYTGLFCNIFQRQIWHLVSLVWTGNVVICYNCWERSQHHTYFTVFFAASQLLNENLRLE